jgi:general nucleoside transport system ATP-binding protein
VARELRALSERYGLELDPDATVGDLPIGRRQRVEILKALMRGADLLVLDEPTSNLSPPEVAGLLGVMRRLRAEGKAIIFISHKLGEVLEVCDQVAVLRDGRLVGRAEAKGATRGELARMMVGRDLAEPLRREDRAAGEALLELRGVSCATLRDIGFTIRAGEVLAIAGVDGNGQFELVETIAGTRRASRGAVRIAGREVTWKGPAARVRAGLSYIPADRAHTSAVQAMSVAENVALRDIRRQPYSRFGWLNPAIAVAAARRLIADFAIRAPGPEAAIRQLSGGNQQKVVVAREIDRAPRVLIAHQATWGLDPGATRFVLDRVLALRAAGAAVLYVSSELEEVLAVGDRIGVMFDGRMMAILDRHEVDLGRIGALMAGAPAPATGLAA